LGVTAHRPKPVTLTPELVERFRDYRRRESAWGVLHCMFDDGNWYGPASPHCYHPTTGEQMYTDEEVALCLLVDRMTASRCRWLTVRCSGTRPL
jgi:hypothetical protein